MYRPESEFSCCRLGERGFVLNARWRWWSVHVKTAPFNRVDSVVGALWISMVRNLEIRFTSDEPFELKDPETLDCLVRFRRARVARRIVLPSRRGQYYFWEARRVRREAERREAEKFVAQMFPTSVRSPCSFEEED